MENNETNMNKEQLLTDLTNIVHDLLKEQLTVRAQLRSLQAQLDEMVLHVKSLTKQRYNQLDDVMEKTKRTTRWDRLMEEYYGPYGKKQEPSLKEKITPLFKV